MKLLRSVALSDGEVEHSWGGLAGVEGSVWSNKRQKLDADLPERVGLCRVVLVGRRRTPAKTGSPKHGRKGRADMVRHLV